MVAKTKVYGLLWGVQRSVRYHGRRRAWFERLHNTTMVLAVFSTSGAAVTVQVQQLETSSTVLTLVTGLLLATNIVVGFARRAAHHRLLAVRFRDLEAKLRPLRELSDEEYQEFLAERLAIESEEPPVKRLLDALCHYELKRATRRDLDAETAGAIAAIPLWRRMAAQWASQATYATQLRP